MNWPGCAQWESLMDDLLGRYRNLTADNTAGVQLDLPGAPPRDIRVVRHK